MKRVISKKLVFASLCFVVLLVAFGAYGYVSALDIGANGMVITPRVDCSGIQLNETAYRLHGGKTLNFTFEFSTEGTATANLPIHYSHWGEVNFTGIHGGAVAYLEEFQYNDGRETVYTYIGIGGVGEGFRHATGKGLGLGNSTPYFPSGGDHVLKYVFLFTIEGEAEGYLDINFLSEVVLTVVESDLPSLTSPQLIAVSAATGGAAIAGIIGAAVFIKKRRSKPISTES